MANEEFFDEEFIINLTIDGTSYEEVEVKVTDPTKEIREQIDSIIRVLGLPIIDLYGHPFQYVLVKVVGNKLISLNYQNSEGHEMSLLEYDIAPGDSLHLLSVPIYISSQVEKNENKDLNDNEFFINLTIEGTQHENANVRIKDPTETIRNQISSIVRVFKLPKMDCGGNPIQYLLGQMSNDEEPELFDFDDEDGRELSLMDYNIQPGDFLYLMSIPIAGYACPIPEKMAEEWETFWLNKE